ncbi:MAG: hypothetical protein ACRELC_07505, partial [Gemmatimonadota bacterium]
RAPAVERLAAALGVAGEAGPTLVAVFQPGDCVVFSGLTAAWNALYEDRALRVVGVGVRFSDLDRAALDSRPGPVPRFPIRSDLGPLAERAILDAGHRRTPVALLLDGLGRSRVLIPPVRGARRVREIEALVRRHVELALDE